MRATKNLGVFQLAWQSQTQCFLCSAHWAYYQKLQLSKALHQFKEHYIIKNTGEFDIPTKAVILAHVGMNCMGMAQFKDVFWIFEYFDSVAQEIIDMFQEHLAVHHILLDIVSEILCCYQYHDYHSDSLFIYQKFVKDQVEKKYVSINLMYEYRYYADAKWASDHEAISIYHLITAYPSGVPNTTKQSRNIECKDEKEECYRDQIKHVNSQFFLKPPSIVGKKQFDRIDIASEERKEVPSIN